MKSIDVQADVNEVQIPRTLADFYAMNGMVDPVDMTDDELDRIIQGG